MFGVRQGREDEFGFALRASGDVDAGEAQNLCGGRFVGAVLG